MNSLGVNKPVEETRVVVAMSGGVDSSVVAAMLADEGYEVIGITLQLYDYGEAVRKKGACCAGQDIHDARRVAEAMGIPHYVLDYESRFKQGVIDDFVDGYLHGETPIPCVSCNQSVKFRDLLGTAKDLGADVLATGHYIQRKAGKHKAELHRGADVGKDQSYFLFATTQEQLDFLRFPLGGMNKDQTRELARKYGLIVQDKPDSQDICFVPNGNYASVIERFKPGSLDGGEIVNEAGEVLGQHDGIINFTVGQRRGIGIAHSEPLYVIRIDPESRRVVVGPRTALGKEVVYLRQMNWLGDRHPSANEAVTVKFRSTHHGVLAHVAVAEDGQAMVVFDEPQYGVSPGQACVIYDGSRVLGGGWITRDEHAESTFKQARRA
jgi:tRNA-specific 2-thiouridylase